MEVLIICGCGEYLKIRESYAGLGEIVIKVDKCCNCIKDGEEKGREDGYGYGYTDGQKEVKSDYAESYEKGHSKGSVAGYAQCKDDINNALEKNK